MVNINVSVIFLFSLIFLLFCVTLALNEILTVILNKTMNDVCAYDSLF